MKSPSQVAREVSPPANSKAVREDSLQEGDYEVAKEDSHQADSEVFWGSLFSSGRFGGRKGGLSSGGFGSSQGGFSFVGFGDRKGGFSTGGFGSSKGKLFY